MTKKTTSTKKTQPALGEVMVVYTKSSAHWQALLQPSFVTIEKAMFIEGKQITGKPGHRMEGKRTLIPLDHVASLVEFASEDDLWSEPQAKLIRPPVEESQSALLTSHEQAPPPGSAPGGGRHRHHRRNRNKRHKGQGAPYGQGGAGHDPRFERY